jgi:uncharacterized protein
MNTRFADTFYFIALFSEKDAAHAAATQQARLRQRLITTTFVITELGDGLAETTQRSKFKPYIDLLRSSPDVKIIVPDQIAFERALDLYHDRQDQKWSLTDCISFIVMDDYQITEALTGDHHFEQAGFHALLK